MFRIGCLKNSITICVSFFLALQLSYGQSNPYNEVSISSPTAAALGKYADIPVSYHTGTPQINIPIYTVKEGPLTLPVSLSYHAGGLKVMETSSWVGANWSLNAGGVITRTVQGTPDEKATSNNASQEWGHFTDYGYNSYYMYDDPSRVNGVNFHDDMIGDGRMDGEPDLFFFNVSGFSGKFYFNEDRVAVTVPEQDVKIQPNYTGSGSIASFIITTPDGTKYHFGRTASASDTDPIEQTDPFTVDAGLTEGRVISSWFLNKIESFDNKFSISLEYVAERYAFNTISMFPIMDDAPGGTYEYKLVKNIVKGVRLSKIKFSNGSIEFVGGDLREDLGNFFDREISFDNLNDEARSLGEIVIHNIDSSSCKKHKFYYGYFESNESLQGFFASWGMVRDKKRLRLDSLQEMSCDNSVVIPAHKFYYDNNVPRRLSFAQDHWGFYNGKINNTQFIPTYIQNKWTIHQGADRDASWPHMRGGALLKIVYPTNGSTEFVYEPHDTRIIGSKFVEPGVYTFQVSVGFGNPTNPKIESKSLTSNPYRIKLSNTLGGSNASLTVTNSSNAQVAMLIAQPGESNIETTIEVPAGNYSVSLFKENVPAGTGAAASFYELVQTSYDKNEIVGGLRIDSIKTGDGITDVQNITTFSYTDANGKSFGELYGRPTYVQVLRNDILGQAGMNRSDPNGPPNPSPEGCLTIGGFAYYKSGAGIRPMESTQGGHIGYSQVKVSQSGNGYSIFKYYTSNNLATDDVAYRNVNSNSCTLDIPNYPSAPLEHDFTRGELQFEFHHKENGDIILEKEYQIAYQANLNKTPGYIVFRGPAFVGTMYDLKTAKKVQTTVIEKTHDESGGISTTSTTTYFGSLFHSQGTRTTTTNSLNQFQESKIKYAADFRLPDCDAINSCFNAYQSARINAEIQWQQTKGSCANNSYCEYWAYQDYRKALVLARQSFISCRVNYLNPAVPGSFAACLVAKKNSADAQLKPILELQEIFVNAPIESTSWIDGKLTGASFNTYNFNSQIVYPEKAERIYLGSPTSAFTASTSTNSTINRDTRYKEEASIKFHNGNMAELIKKDGITTSYIWGYNSQYPVAKVIGASLSSVSAILNQSVIQNPSSDVALRTELDKIRQQFPRALVTTYTYKPLMGITSETSPNRITVFYEYDALSRLKLIRDRDGKILKSIEYKYQQTQQ